jgi:aminotransferase
VRSFVSKRAKDLKPSGIRKFFDLASKQKDVISLGVGEPDFVTPWEIRDAGITAIKKGYTQYTSNSGLKELRTEISDYLKFNFNVEFTPDQTVITVGASEAIDAVLRAVVDEGDEVLIPDPSYVSYKPCVELVGGKAVTVQTDMQNGFKLTPENLEKAITDKTKALILSLNSPNPKLLLFA